MTMPGTAWEYLTLEFTTGRAAMDATMNRLGSLGWEAVGVSGVDKTIGLNGVIVLLKRAIPSKPSPDDESAGWKADPYGRFALRWWDGLRWTEHVHKEPGSTTPELDAPIG